MNRSGLHFAWGKRLPVLLQSEVTECGQTCLAMILNYHGHDIDLLKLFGRALNAGIRLEKIKIVLQTLRGAMSGLQLVAIVWVGGHELLGNALSVGMLYAFLVFARRFSA